MRLKEYLNPILFIKGVAMGVANIIPGVSGGTIALITGIYEKLIFSIKKFDSKAFKLLMQFKFKEFAEYIHLQFLFPVIIGIIFAGLSLAKIFDYLFENYPVFLWAYFFGLVLASVYYVGKMVESWKKTTYILFLTGAIVAVSITIIDPLKENRDPVYIFFNGVISIVGMVLPGLSGSFLLILLGNYQIILIDAINNFDLKILLPFALGSIVGLLAFSHVLSWLLKNYRNETIALLTGFVLGSLGILWPWKEPVYLVNNGEIVVKHGKKLVAYYEHILPRQIDSTFFLTLFFMFLGIISIIFIEIMYLKEKKNKK